MDIRIDEQLWATHMTPEGLLERWRVADGAFVRQGEAVAEVRIEDSLHNILAPADGRITYLVLDNGFLEPGTVIARVEA